ncbi:hypothetical protein GF324_10025 [bacterium]|nr:hypothetical protein [bacterium]
MERKHHFTESPYEESVGFSRAIRAGNQIHVAGTAAIGADGRAVAPGDAYPGYFTSSNCVRCEARRMKLYCHTANPSQQSR